jgi:uncharacterized membrane protein YeiH
MSMMIEKISDLNLDVWLDYVGAFAFCLSGASIALSRKMDVFGIFILAVVTGFGGGMVRDVILGNTPPLIFRTPVYWIIALIAAVVILIPSHFIHQKLKIRLSKKVVYFFDAFGLAFYTVVGIKAGLAKSLHSYQCVMMGVLTACFGGVLRDIIVNRVPLLFQKDIYASVSIVGGVIFFLLEPIIQDPWLEFIVIGIIFSTRLVVVIKNLNLPQPKIRIKSHKF